MKAPTRLSELAAIALLLAARSAQADPTAPTDADKAAAKELFEDAKKLADAQQFPEACAKYEKSFQLYAASGTLLNLALCHEQIGRFASAYREFRDSVARAESDRRPERKKTAQEHADALKPKLSYLTVTVSAGAEVDGFAVTVDGGALSKPAWGIAVPIDPGAHVVAAKAAGRRPWSTNVTIGEVADKKSVEVPVLPVEPAAPSSAAPSSSSAPGAAPTMALVTPTPPLDSAGPPAQSATSGPGSGQRPIGVALMVIGGVGIVTGGVFGLLARGHWNDATGATACPNAICPNAATASAKQSDVDAARSTGLISTIGFIAGGAALAAGAYFFFTASSVAAAPSTTARVRLAPQIAPGLAALRVEGTL